MPQEADFEFGKKAVAEGLLSQDRLEEVVELLMGLEKAGSGKRLWDLVVERGWMRREDASRLRPQKVAAAPLETATPEELPGQFVLAQIRSKEEPKIIPLAHRPMSVGRDKSNDICLQGSGVEMHHARITFTDTGPRIWDMGSEAGVVVNGTRRRSCDLRPDDLVKIGDVLLVVCYDLAGDAGRQEPVSADRVAGEPVGKFYVEEGERQGEIFYLGRRGMTFGRHRLATVRLNDGRVTLLHTHVAAGASAVRMVDLKSSFGTTLNGRATAKGDLDTGDIIGVGDVKLRFAKLGGPLSARDVASAARVAPPPAPAIGPPAQERKESHASSFMIPSDAELDMGDEKDAYGAPAAPEAMPDETRDDATLPEAYELGELILQAIDGPLEGQHVTIKRRTTTIGRANDADLTIPELSVSRLHARLTLSPEGVLEIEDLGSRNGVRINGHKVTKAALRVGDTIRLGTTTMIIDRKQA